MKKPCFLICLAVSMLLAAGCAAGTNSASKEAADSGGSQVNSGPAAGVVNGSQPDQGRADNGDDIGKPDDNTSEPAENTGKQDGSAGKQDGSAGKQEESAGKQDGSAGKQEESAGKQEESAGKQDGSAGKQDGSAGKQDGSAGKAEENPEQAGRNGEQPGEEASGSAVMPWPSTRVTVNDIEGVSMTIKEGTVTPTGLTVILENTAEKTYIYGEAYILEKKVEDTWYKLKYTYEGNFAFFLIGYNLGPGRMTEWAIRWDIPYGTLDEGEYRILKSVIPDDDNDGKPDEYWLAAEFAITGAEP
jgi:hypothetical protein